MVSSSAGSCVHHARRPVDDEDLRSQLHEKDNEIAHLRRLLDACPSDMELKALHLKLKKKEGEAADLLEQLKAARRCAQGVLVSVRNIAGACASPPSGLCVSMSG